MLAKKIKYTDYDGNQREETFYFNISKAELAEMNLTTTGGIEKMLQIIIDKQDIPALVQVMKDFITKSYGVKSLDGRKMVKNQEALDDFLQTEAYSELLMEILYNAEAALAFIKGIMPIDESQKEEVDRKISELLAEEN